MFVAMKAKFVVTKWYVVMNQKGHIDGDTGLS